MKWKFYSHEDRQFPYPRTSDMRTNRDTPVPELNSKTEFLHIISLKWVYFKIRKKNDHQSSELRWNNADR